MSGLGAGATLGWREWNVSRQVVAMYGAPTTASLEGRRRQQRRLQQTFNSSESPMNRPELVIRYAAPDTRPPKTTIDCGPPER